jgi:hypothetical protein
MALDDNLSPASSHRSNHNHRHQPPSSSMDGHIPRERTHSRSEAHRDKQPIVLVRVHDKITRSGSNNNHNSHSNQRCPLPCPLPCPLRAAAILH